MPQRAQHADIDTLAQARAYAHDLDAQVARAEAAAARAFAETRADMPHAAIDLAADVAVLQAEVDFLEAAGARSPAAMYRVPDDALARLDDASERAVIAIANSAQATQLLQLGEDADKPAALAAIAAAAHHHQHRMLALPATEAGANYAEEHRYADTTTTAAAGIDNLQSGRWNPPTGSLLIIDDADQLPAEQLHWVTTNTAATNTKLLLVTNTGAPPPRHTLTDVLAGHLPWAQHLGAIDADQQRNTAMQPAAHHLTATPGDDTDHHTQARDFWPGATNSPTATTPPPSAQSGATPTSTATKAATAGSNSDNRRAGVLIGRRSRPSSLSAPGGRHGGTERPAMTRPRPLHSGPHRMVMTRPARRPESLDVVCRKGGQVRPRAAPREAARPVCGALA